MASTGDAGVERLRRSAPTGRFARGRRRRRDVHWSAYLYLVPAFVFFGGFILWPLGETVWTSFFQWDGLSPGVWVGLDNYEEIWRNVDLRSALLHSVVFIFFYAVLPVLIALALAGAMTRARVHGMTVFRALLFIPQVLPMVVVAVSWRWIYDVDGPLNRLLEFVGLGSLTRGWLGNFSTALPSVGLIGTWFMFGLCLVLFIAGIQKIPTELYEAARIDGAGPVREFLAVTLPDLRGEIAVALTITTIFALRNFDLVWNTTAGGPGTSTTVPSVFIYRAAFVTREIGLAAALGVCLAIVILVVVVVINRVVAREDA
jgi:raffinose/stachyose/melibiose transport system permease protein